MGNANFMRRYILKCGKEGEKGFSVGYLKDAGDIALHVSFSVEKSNAESPNSGKIQVWNLSKKNIRILETKGCIAELRAGYGDNMATVIVGNVASATTSIDNADRMTEITVVDGLEELKDTNISVSINNKVNSKEVYIRIAKAMGIPVVFAKELVFKTFPNGYQYVGKAKNALQKVSRFCGFKWTIHNKVLQVTLPGRAISTKGFVMSSETGLINTPKRVAIDKKSGYEIEYLLNGAVGVNDIVEVKSKSVNGYFLIHKVNIDGDNLEGDWLCSAQVLRISDKQTKKKVSKKNK